jgi:hypothetical protein
MKKFIAVAAVLASGFAAAENVDLINSLSPQKFEAGIYVGSKSSHVEDVTSNKVTRILGASATVNFATTLAGTLESSALTVTGAKAGDPCFVGVPTAAGALKALYTCYVSAAGQAVIVFHPVLEDFGTTDVLNGASPSVATATVTTGTACVCTGVGTTAAIAAAGCAASVTTTTLTVTSANSGNWAVNYYCRKTVDPASGTFFVRVLSSQ